MDPDRVIHLVSRLRDRANHHMQLQFERLGIGDLAPAHGGVLYALGAGPATMSDLARMLERDNSTITTLVGRLVQGGYATRRRSPEDSRSRLIELTPEGRRALVQVKKASRAVLRRFYGGMPVSDREELIRLLSGAYSNLGE